MMSNGVISCNYWNEVSHEKAKTNLVLLILFIPGWIFFTISVFFISNDFKAIFLLWVPFVLILISNVVKMFGEKGG